MSHSHTHIHDHSPQTGEEMGDRNLIIALFLNVSLTLVQIIGGILSGSLSLLADAAHNGSDAASIGVSYGARRVARQKADRQRTFGYNRAEIIGALINLTTLLIIAVFLAWQAVDRFLHPRAVEGTTMLIVGAIAFVEDGISAYLLYQGSKESLNIKSAFIHMLADTLATVGVIISGLLIMFYELHLSDPILTALIALYIFLHSYHEIKGAIRILMESSPEGLEFDRMIQHIRHLPGVQDIHHVHTWMLDEERAALEAHVVVAEHDLSEIEAIKRRIKHELETTFGIDHTTLELEIEGLTSHGSSVISQC